MNGVGRERWWWGGGRCGVGVCLRLVHTHMRKLCLEPTILRQVYTERRERRRVEGKKEMKAINSFKRNHLLGDSIKGKKKPLKWVQVFASPILSEDFTE